MEESHETSFDLREENGMLRTLLLVALMVTLASDIQAQETAEQMHNRIMRSRAASRRDPEDALRRNAIPLELSKGTIDQKFDPQQIVEQQAFLERSERQRIERIKELTRWRKMRRDMMYLAELKELKASKGSYVPWIETLEVGVIGTLRNPRYGSSFSPLKIIQVINGNEMLARTTRVAGHKNEALVWLRGFATGGHADGRYLVLGHTVKVTGTKRYTTVGGGTETVLVLEPFPIDPEAVRKHTRKLKIWTYITGKQVEADFVSLRAGKVKLRKANGKTITLSIERLSKQDQEWIRRR